ncbi:Alpha/beta hydrolase fold-1 [Xylariaceae sp. FL0804]|nr:Alpha/beta hydrolase fold-1 [Xylariaceae sp. FL0804]
MSEPTNSKGCGILFACGAFHPAACFDGAKARLEAAGFAPVLVSSHPSLGEGCAGRTMFDDAAALQAQLAPHVDGSGDGEGEDEGGREFIVLGHSYGGFPGFTATQGWTLGERTAAGRKGGVRAVVFVAATVPVAVGGCAIAIFPEAAQDARGGPVYPPFLDHGPPGVRGQVMTPNALSKTLFYSDLSAEERDRCAALMLPMSQDAIETPVTYTVADVPDLPKYYMVTERDETVPPEAQRAVASAIPNVTVLSIDAGHSPFISQLDRFVELIEQVAAA